MNQKLLLRVKLPTHRITWRKSLVLPLMNVVLGMNHWSRKRLHDSMQKDFIDCIRSEHSKHPFYHTNDSQYRISIGYYRGIGESGKKTKTLDADGLAYIGKVAIDSLIQCTAIPNDSVFTIPEFRCVYLGERAEEEIWLQVSRDEQQSKYIVVSEYMTDWFECKDRVTGGRSIVHRTQL